jgi:hypothetical protein
MRKRPYLGQSRGTACIIAREGVNQRVVEAKQRATATRAEAVRGAISETAHLSTSAAVDTLSRRGIRTATSEQWRAMQVYRVRRGPDLRYSKNISRIFH